MQDARNTQSSRDLCLLDFAGATSSFDFFLNFLGFVLCDPLLERLRHALNQILCFLETQACDRADNLDNANLVLAKSGEDHIKFGFLSWLLRLGASATTSACRRN